MNGYTAQGADGIRVADYLPRGQENAVPLRDLVAILRLPGRTVRRMIETERRAGVLICADNKSGYFLAADEYEAKRFAASMRRRAGEILETAEAIEAAVEGAGKWL